MVKTYFFSYGDNKFTKSKERILKEANESNFFDYCSVYGPKNIEEEFKIKFGDILKQRRGGGYWIWKFYFINKYLQEINEGDYLIYCDTGCTINKDGINRFNEYKDLLKKSDYGIISFEMKYKEYKYTIKELYNYLNLDINNFELNNSQYAATVLILKKCSHSLLLIDECLKLLNFDKKLITDYYNKYQGEYFIDNRHDQSILSLLRKKYGSIILNDETYTKINKDTFDPRFPFWATRIRI